MTAHKCDTTCDGAKELNGGFILCRICALPSYLGCLKAEKEMDALIKSMGIDKARGDKVGQIGAALNAMFASDSMISFRCSSCQLLDSNSIGISNENESLKQKNAELLLKINELEKKNIETPMDAETAASPVTHEMLQNKLQQMEERIVSKIAERMQLNDRNREREEIHASKRKRSDDNTHRNMGIHLQSANQNGNEKKSLLKPPKAKIDDRSIYEIHVSKFSIEMTANTISQHIMENSSILTPDLFKVEPMNSRKMNNAHFSTFKISTFSKRVYTRPVLIC